MNFRGIELPPAYYQDEWVYIIHGDCREILPSIPDKSIDLVLTDPPYGKKCSKGTNGYGSAQNRNYTDSWDNKPPEITTLENCLKCSVNQIIFGGNYFVLPISNCWLVWDKKGDIAFNNPFADCELCWTSFNKPIKKYTFKQQGFIKDSKDKVEHPTQKPSELIAVILRDWSKEYELILDPFLGSGTTARAAKDLNRYCIGIEIEEKYCEIAAKRCCQSVMELNV